MFHKVITFISLLSILLIAYEVDNINTTLSKLNNLDSVSIVDEPPKIFLLDNEEVNDSIMLEACYYFGIKEPYIVTAQAILESGNFKSNAYKYLNNPFGLYNSKHKIYYRFDHWTESIVGYQTMIEYKRLKNESYYKFLNRIGYAEDPDYINKVKIIEKDLKRKFPL